MIDKHQFAKMRLADWIEASLIENRANWEYMGHSWVGEGYIFSDWLREASDPDTLVSLTIDLRDFPSAESVLNYLQLPIRYRMNVNELVEVLGPSRWRHIWDADRSSYLFSFPAKDSYSLDCTITNGEGLHFITIMTWQLDMVLRYSGYLTS